MGGHYAPMFTFLWRCILSLIPLPVALPCAFLIQQTAYWMLIGLLALQAHRQGCALIAWATVAMGLAPPLLCFSIAIESNVLGGTAWGLAIAHCAARRHPSALKLAAPLWAIGYMSRYGMIVSAIPAAASMLLLAAPGISKLRAVLLAASCGALMQCTTFCITKYGLDNPSSMSVVSISQLYDLAGMQSMGCRIGIPSFAIPKGATATEVLQNYDPRFCSTIFWRDDGQPVLVQPSNMEHWQDLQVAWISAIFSDFDRYAAIKLRFAEEFLMVGKLYALGPNPEFSGGAALGISAPTDEEAHWITRYSRWTQLSAIWRPWVWLSVSLACVCAGLLMKARSAWAAAAAWTAAVAALLPHLLMGQAVACRYYFTTFLLCGSGAAFVAPELYSRWRTWIARRRSS